jgi:hypothetical protein
MHLAGWRRRFKRDEPVVDTERGLGAKGRRIRLIWYLQCVCAASKIGSKTAASHNGAAAGLEFLLAVFEQLRQEGR